MLSAGNGPVLYVISLLLHVGSGKNIPSTHRNQLRYLILFVSQFSSVTVLSQSIIGSPWRQVQGCFFEQSVTGTPFLRISFSECNQLFPFCSCAAFCPFSIMELYSHNYQHTKTIRRRV